MNSSISVAIHRYALACVVMLLLYCAVLDSVSAQEAAPAAAPARLSLAPVGELSPDAELSPLLRGGRAVRDPRQWRASLYPISGDGCTATLIGPQVLLLAAHCIADQGIVAFKMGDSPHEGPCSHADEYRGDVSADYALCKITPAVKGVKFERISQDTALLVKLTQVLLTGFGCTRSNGTGGRDGIFRIGESPILSLPPKDGNIVVTKGGAALCIGDSGGAVYTGEGSGRRVIAVNIAADPDGGELGDSSRVATLSSRVAQKFVTDWTVRNGSPRICGIGAVQSDCR